MGREGYSACSSRSPSYHDEQDVEVDVSQEDDEDTMLIHKSLFRVDEGLWRETVL